MKIIVISEETRQRMLSENPMLDDIKSSETDAEKNKRLEKERLEKERLEKERLEKERLEKEKNKNKNNDSVSTNNNDKVDTKKVDTNKVDNNKVDNNKVDNNKVDNNKVDNNKIDNKTDKIPVVTDTDLSKTTTPPKPTNPSGKIIPKPKKPLMKNSPAAKAGIPIEQRQKMSNMNAAFQATKRKDSGYTKMDFIKDFPNSQTAKKFNKGERIPGFKYPKKTKKVKADPGPNLKDMSAISKPKEVTIDDFKSTPAPKKEEIKSSYEPYHIVLGYLLHEGHADTIKEAHYVMTQMDEQTIKEIVALDEGLGGKIASVAAGTLGIMGLDAIRKQMQNKKKMEQGGKFTPGSTMDNIQKRNQMLKDM